MIRHPFIAVLSMVLAACSSSKPAGGDARRSDVPTIADVLKRHTDSLMAIPGVVGVGQGEKNGEPTVYVMVARMTDTLRRALPDTIEGYAVDVVVSGEIRAQPHQ